MSGVTLPNRSSSTVVTLHQSSCLGTAHAHAIVDISATVSIKNVMKEHPYE